jgi:ketosteroid isomerase-like protein
VPEESTTSDLEETFRRSIEGFARRDVDAAVAMFAPDAVWETRVGVFEGHEAIRHFVDDWLGTYEDHEASLEAFRYLGNSVAYVVLLQRGRFAGSAGFVENRYASVTYWADGLIKRMTNYIDIDEGRAAAERLAHERG